jgi:hypothetical protein
MVKLIEYEDERDFIREITMGFSRIHCCPIPTKYGTNQCETIHSTDAMVVNYVRLIIGGTTQSKSLSKFRKSLQSEVLFHSEHVQFGMD